MISCNIPELLPTSLQFPRLLPMSPKFPHLLVFAAKVSQCSISSACQRTSTIVNLVWTWPHRENLPEKCSFLHCCSNLILKLRLICAETHYLGYVVLVEHQTSWIFSWETRLASSMIRHCFSIWDVSWYYILFLPYISLPRLAGNSWHEKASGVE